tara:strand:- start:2185 stop:3606 length:1422 start_codon:yes stop_codon:yes gene_type:complete
MIDISIVIVNYNSGSLLQACLDTVIKSDCDYEVILIDNGSIDESLHFLNGENYNNIVTVRNKKNIGFSAALNQANAYCSGTKIIFLNPDCLIFPHTARLMGEALDQDHSTGIIGGLVFNFDGSEQQGCRRREPTLVRSLNKQISFSSSKHLSIDMNRNPLPEKKVVVDAVSGAFFAMKRELFLSVGGMDEDFFLHFEDLDLCRRIREIGKNVVFVPDISIFHYQGASRPHANWFVSKEKHKSILKYQKKHNKYFFFLRWLLLSMVWAHYLYEKVRNSRVLPSKMCDFDFSVFPYSAVAGIESEENRLMVFGVTTEQRNRISPICDSISTSIYWSADYSSVNDLCEKKVLSIEYFEKVPDKEAFRFNSLLLAPNHRLTNDQVIQIVEKCSVKKIGLLTEDLGDKPYSADIFLHESEYSDIKSTLINRLVTNGVPKSRIRLMPLENLPNKSKDSRNWLEEDKKIVDYMRVFYEEW